MCTHTRYSAIRFLWGTTETRNDTFSRWKQTMWTCLISALIKSWNAKKIDRVLCLLQFSWNAMNLRVFTVCSHFPLAHLKFESASVCVHDVTNVGDDMTLGFTAADRSNSRVTSRRNRKLSRRRHARKSFNLSDDVSAWRNQTLMTENVATLRRNPL